MKRIIILIVLAITASCNSDDDMQTLTNDSIVGTWRSYKATLNTGNGPITVDINTECPDDFKSFTFHPDYTMTIYVADGDCNITEEVSATWSKEEPNIYTITGESGSNESVIDIDGDEMIMHGNLNTPIYLRRI